MSPPSGSPPARGAEGAAPPSSKWAPGSLVEIPPRYSTVVEENGNKAHQLVVEATHATIVNATSSDATLEAEEGEDVSVSLEGRDRTPHLRPKSVLANDLLRTDPSALEWFSREPPANPDLVLKSLEGKFLLATEVKSHSPGKGFRTPQLGAIHAVLGYWTVQPAQPGTVVLPTGTGKTETMLALFASQRLERLLVLVPSSALRNQIADKFETYGILPTVIGALGHGFEYPVVGRLEHGFKSKASARRFATACNVVVATPDALRASKSEVMAEFLDLFTHLFVDEAHHVRAKTWDAIRAAFGEKPVLQFTATPYREDRKAIGGRLVYNFPLRLAREQGYFSTIQYIAVRSPGSADRDIASTAVTQLRADLANGLDHILMARVDKKKRAAEVFELYHSLAGDLDPRLLHSGETLSSQREALAAIRSRDSRIVVCVDMLGEGFDLPALKIAAIHDPHKSLGITLQFIGRFARTKDNVGDATVVVSRPDSLYDERLRALYREDADWDQIIQDLSETASSEYETWSDFEKGFGERSSEIAAYDVEPKMSTVVYRTSCGDWAPENLEAHFGKSGFLVEPQVNHAEAVCWFVRRVEQPVQWTVGAKVDDIHHELYVMHWDQEEQLLYINSSNNDGPDPHHLRLAKLVAGEDVEVIRGKAVFRIYHGADRLIPTNIGLLEARNTARKFSMHAGRNVEEGFPEAEQQTKTKTNVFAHGYVDGVRKSIGASTKGRVWEWRSGGNLQQWVLWCKQVGAFLTNENIEVDEIMRHFIRPEELTERPPLVALGVEWPWQVYASTTESLRASLDGEETPLVDTDLAVSSLSSAGPIEIDVRTQDWKAGYTVDFDTNGMTASPTGAEVLIVSDQKSQTFSEFVARNGLTFLMEDDAVIEPPGQLIRPPRNIPPFDRTAIRTDVSWVGCDIMSESMGRPMQRTDSIQATYFNHMVTEPWDVIVNDDGTGEIADLVGLKHDGRELVIQFVHCKYSSELDPGSRLEDLYELCGQAQKSVNWRRDIPLTIAQLIRRERNRAKRNEAGVVFGSMAQLEQIADDAVHMTPQLQVVIVQPGLSRDRANRGVLELLAATRVYVHEVGGAPLEVVASS